MSKLKSSYMVLSSLYNVNLQYVKPLSVMCDCPQMRQCNCCTASRKITVPIIWVLGGPGSGKGTQCDKIVAKYKFTHLSTGDLLRDEVASGSEKGKYLQEIMARGELVPNEEVLGLLKKAMLSQLHKSKGFLIDGYPREKSQGELFEKMISPVNMILFFDASEDILVQRLLGRAQTSGRTDDNEDTIKLRLKTFNANNDQVLKKYPNKLVRINAAGAVDDIFTVVEQHLDDLIASKKCLG